MPELVFGVRRQFCFFTSLKCAVPDSADKKVRKNARNLRTIAPLTRKPNSSDLIHQTLQVPACSRHCMDEIIIVVFLAYQDFLVS